MAARTVNKLELARLLGWSPPKLDRVLSIDRDFPVQTRGGRGLPWTFDPAAALAHCRVHYFEPPTQGELGLAAPAPAARVKLAQAALLEAKLATETGAMVDRHHVVGTIGAAYQRLGKALETLPSQLGREYGWTPKEIRALRERLDEFRRDLVREGQEFVDVIEGNGDDDQDS